jgi:Flp pilus assembly protein TadG
MKRRLTSQRGAALIEMALTFPLLLLVAVSIFEFGRAYQTWQVLTNAAREGARVAVLPNPTDSPDTRVRAYLLMGGLNNDATVLVDVDPVTVSLGAAGGTASASQVTVTYPFSFIVLQPVIQLVVSGSTTGAPITMTAQAVMRNETQF